MAEEAEGAPVTEAAVEDTEIMEGVVERGEEVAEGYEEFWKLRALGGRLLGGRLCLSLWRLGS